MRRAFCDGLTAAVSRPEFVFLTGDLGFGALEPLRDQLGERFINAGVAEQNLVGVAAGLSKAGFLPWVYSIAPFLYARAFEQIRNDVCLHQLPVVLVGNGGGYGYGVMGATHHALEDYGVLLTLPAMRVLIPAFDADVGMMISELFRSPCPAWFRLGLQTQPASLIPPPWAQWRPLIEGTQGVLIAVGPLAGMYWGAAAELPVERRPSVWCLTSLPVHDLPDQLWEQLHNSNFKKLVIAEEHTAHGSVGSRIAMLLAGKVHHKLKIECVTAAGYPSGRYGSQTFHRTESGLDSAAVLSRFEDTPKL
jgi:transketolase